MERCIVGDHRRNATTTPRHAQQVLISTPMFRIELADEGFEYVLGVGHIFVLFS